MCTTTPSGYLAAINDTTVPDPLNGATVPPGQFFEVGLDLTVLTGIAPTCPAPSAASLYLRSITGTPLRDLKGYVAPFAVVPDSTCVVPPLSTTATPGGSTVARGATQTDVATLAAVGNAPVPTGSVTFFLCGPAQVVAAGCPTGGTQVGTGVTLSGGSATSSAVTGATTPNDLTDGRYCWRAEYTPDTPGATHYLPTSHTNADTECFTVVHAAPTIATQINPTGAEPGTLGLTTLGDTATLTGALGNTNGELVTFKLYGPFADAVTPVCTGSPLCSTTGALSGGTATASMTFSPTAIGRYVWTATYGGDALNSPATNTCNEATEQIKIVGADINVTKAANPAGPLSAGDTVGFDISVTNTVAATATNVVITDALPAGTGLNWSLTPPFAGCSITGVVGAQTLTCAFATVAKGATVGPIHVTSPTTPAECGTIRNTASFTSDNAGQGSAGGTVLKTVFPA